MNSDTQEDDDDRKMAQDDGCWDGMWLADGLYGMMISLDSNDFCDDETEEFLDDQKEFGLQTQEQDEFLTFPLYGDEEAWAQLQTKVLDPRNLHIADGVIRRLCENNCPPRIRIRKLESEDMEELMKHKKLGNEAFSKKEYEKAIECYDEALLTISNLFVAPKEQVNEVVNVLSNQAECYLRLKQYQDAGAAATDALMFNCSHEKSRLRRAKAEMAIAGVYYLVQAKVDLESILEEKGSKAGLKQAKEYLEELEELLEMEKKKYEKKKPDSDWNLYIQILRAKCW